MKYQVHTRTYWPCLRPCEGQTSGLYDIEQALFYVRIIRDQDARDGIGADYWLVPV